MQTQYSFITHWKFNATMPEVWDAIYNANDWPNWWKGSITVKDIEKGAWNGIGSIKEFTWKGFLPFYLKYKIKLTDRIEHKLLSGKAWGDLNGNGTWHFEEVKGVIHVTCYWDIYTSKPWMNYLSFILKPIFKLNHACVMRQGAEGLGKYLHSKVVSC